MTYSRRAILALASSALAAPALADDNRILGDRFDDDLIQPVVYRSPSIGRVRLRSVVLLDPSGQVLFDQLAQGAPRFHEDRLPLNRIIGGIFRPTIEDRIAAGRRVGSVFLDGQRVVLRPSSPLLRPGATPRLILAHREQSWEAGPLRLASGVPEVGADTPQIGRLYRVDRELLAVLDPA